MKVIKNKKLLALTTFVCLLPIAMYLIVYDRLPEHMVQQWGLDGGANWTMPRQWAIFVLPLFLAAVHLIVVTVTHYDPKREKTSAFMQHLIFWLVPAVSIFANLTVIFANLGVNFDVGAAALVFAGLLFIIIGNNLPKNRQNYTVGIRLPWTLHDADNWNKTHRLAGRLLVLSGILLILGALMPLPAGALAALLAAAIVLVAVVPSVYSFTLYRKSKRT